MGRRSERLSKQGILASDLSGEGDVIQVVSRAFDVLRCFEGHEARLGNLEISNRCGLPRSTVVTPDPHADPNGANLGLPCRATRSTGSGRVPWP
jgi:Transcriptional regulator